MKQDQLGQESKCEQICQLKVGIPVWKKHLVQTEVWVTAKAGSRPLGKHKTLKMRVTQLR